MAESQLVKDPKTALLNTRIIWGTLLMGQLIFLFVVLAMADKMEPMDQETARLFTIIVCGTSVMSIGMGLFIRMQIYKKNWQGDCVSPSGYVGGNMIALASIEGMSLFSLVVVLLSGEVGMNLILPVIFLALFVLNFPNGKAMKSATPDFARKPSDVDS